MAKSNRVRAVTAVAFDASTLDAVNYELLATVTDPLCILRIVNFSKMPVAISYDDADNPNKELHDYVMASESLVLNFQANKQGPGKLSLMSRGTNIYVAGAPSAGWIIYTGYTLEEAP